MLAAASATDTYLLHYSRQLLGVSDGVDPADQIVLDAHRHDAVDLSARLAEASVAEEVAAALGATGKDVSIGGAGLAAQAIELDLVDELRMFRSPIVVGAGTPFLPPVNRDIPLDLVETRTFGSRVIYERYRRTRGPRHGR